MGGANRTQQLGNLVEKMKTELFHLSTDVLMLEDGKNQRSEQSQSEAIHVSGRSNGFKRIDREELFRVLSPFGPSNDHIHILLARRTLSCYSFLHF